MKARSQAGQARRAKGTRAHVRSVVGDLAQASVPDSGGTTRSGHTLRERSQQLVVYLSPQFHKALRVYAAEAETRVHDLVLQALDDWRKRRGIAAGPRA